MKASKIAYTPVGLALGAASGWIAGAAFKQAWKIIEGDGDAPDATDEDRSWQQILIAAAIQGVIFGVVKATVQRSGAVATRRLTGTWPG
ncbi:DUF4235 domain-containing protein [Streptomyces sp. NPDC091267]|uniref:DUF4235 domain-containing protein n=1 Tax=Streptomyces sp. NPDC091267 TaxID=3155195 RepID=UPI00342AF653